MKKLFLALFVLLIGIASTSAQDNFSLASIEASQDESAQRLAEIETPWEQLSPETQQRLIEAADTELLLAEMAKARDRFQEALLAALVQMSMLEIRLGEEQSARYEEGQRLSARIAALEMMLDENGRERLAEVADELFLVSTEKEREDLRDAHSLALEQIASLESKLALEQASRMDESQRLAARIAALEANLDEEARMRLLEAAAAQAVQERLEEAEGESAKRFAEIGMLREQLDEIDRERLAEAAAAALLLGGVEKEREDLRDAHSLALEQIASLESKLALEQASRMDESQRLAARIAVLEGNLDEEARQRLVELAALEAAREKLEATQGESSRRFSEIETLKEQLGAETQGRLIDAAATALLLADIEKARNRLQDAHVAALAQVSMLEIRFAEEQGERQEESQRLAARIAALEGKLDEEAQLRLIEVVALEVARKQLESTREESEQRLADIESLNKQLDAKERARLMEAAAAELLLGSTEKERDEIRTAHSAALAEIMLLESRLSEEQSSRLSEKQRLATRIAVLEAKLDEEARNRLIEIAALQAAKEQLENAEGLSEQRLAEIGNLRERLDEKESERLLESAAAEVLLNEFEKQQEMLDAELAKAKEEVVILEKTHKMEQDAAAEEKQILATRIAVLLEDLEDRERQRLMEVAAAKTMQNELDVVRSLIDERTAKIEALESELSESQRQRLAAAAAETVLREKLQELEDQREQLTLDFQRARKRVAVLETEVAEERNSKDEEVRRLATRIAALQKDLDEKEEERLIQIAAAQSLRDRLGKNESDTSIRIAAIKDLENRLGESERERAVKAAAAQLLSQKIEEQQKKLEEELAKARQDLVATEQSAEDDRKSQEEEIAELRNRLALLTNEISEEERRRLLEAAAAKIVRKELEEAKEDSTRLARHVELLRSENREDEKERLAQIEGLKVELDDKERERLREAAAAEAIRKRLEEAERRRLQEQRQYESDARDAQIAMSLEWERLKKEAEDALTLLAAAQEAKIKEGKRAEEALSESEKNVTLLKIARRNLESEEAFSAESRRKIALLNEQMLDLRTQVRSLSETLDASSSNDNSSQVEIKNLGERLNQALAREAAEKKRRLEAETKERKRLEEQAKQLERYKSEFFGRLRELLEGRDGVAIEGDRFLFSSEVLFETGRTELSEAGEGQLAVIASLINDLSSSIPKDVDWIIRVDGHTDDVPFAGDGQFGDNWELSQGRSLAVVRYLVDFHGVPEKRLAAAGFGEHRPISANDTPEGRSRNRRIELKLTEP